MHRVALSAIFAFAAFAQGSNPFDKPPADVDKALRARIQEFYDDHVKGEFRKAEKLVAEDTQDYYYSHEKPHYVSCTTKEITYSEKYTKALAIVICKQKINMPMISGEFDIPGRSSWKLENGQWMWWIDPALVGESPFGKMKAGPEASTAAGPTAGFSMETAPKSADFLFNQVKVDVSEVTIAAGQSATVKISNSAPGTMSVSVPAKPAGIEATLDKKDLKQADEATLTLTAAEDAKPGVLTLNVEVAQTGQLLPIKIAVK